MQSEYGVTSSSLFEDFRSSLTRRAFWVYSAWLDIILKYRETKIGPIWIVLSTFLFIVLLGSIYFTMLGGNNPARYFVHLATGLVLWQFIQGALLGACRVFVSNKNFLFQGRSTLTDFIAYLLFNNLILMLHNFVIVIAVFIYFSKTVPLEAMYSIFGFLILFGNVAWIVVVLSILGTRYKDIAEIMQFIIRISFLATPIIWMPTFEKARTLGGFLYLNPFYYLLEVVRAPLQGELPPWEIWCVPIATLFLGWAGAAILYRRYASYVPVWL